MVVIPNLCAQTSRYVKLIPRSDAIAYNAQLGNSIKGASKFFFKTEKDKYYEPIGTHANNLRFFLIRYPDAIKPLNTYRFKKMTSVVTGVISLGGFLSFMSLKLDNSNRNQNPLEGLGLLGGSIAGGIITAILSSSANKHLTEAVDIYNNGLSEDRNSYIPDIKFEQEHLALNTPFCVSLSIPIR